MASQPRKSMLPEAARRASRKPLAPAAPTGDDEVTGTQLLDRSVAVLKYLGEAGGEGAKASTIAEAIGLAPSTAHRIIGALERHGFIEREGTTKRFRLGLSLFVLGAQAADGTGLRRLCRPVLLRLAAETGDTVFLMVRSGFNTVCADRQEGTYMIGSLTGNVGGQIPLGVGPASQAILAFLPPEESDVVMRSNAPLYPSFNGLSVEEIANRLPQIRKQGYVADHGRLVEGISAIAVPIKPPGRDVVAALAINMTSARCRGDRQIELIERLRREVREIENSIRATDIEAHQL
jgi:DNA-binding IclR family transcriptional regulator